MSTKTYTLLTESRQWPTKKVGATVELPQAAAKYLVQAGVLAEAVTATTSVAETATEAKPRRKAEG